MPWSNLSESTYEQSMNLNHLAIFHAVAETGSVSRGAARLFISQPAVSKQLSEFESALGTPLFDRLPRGMRLTEAGQVLYAHSRQLFAIQARADQALRELADLEAGRLAIGASTSISAYLLPEALSRFHLRHPGIELRLESGNTEEVQQRLREGALDIGLTEGFVEANDLTADTFHEDELVVIASPFSPYAATPLVTAARLVEYPLILREAGSGTRAVLERALRQAGLPLPSPMMTLDNTETIKRVVAAGAGVAVVSRLAISAEVATGSLIALFLADLVLRRPLHRLRLRGKHEGRAVDEFLRILQSTLDGGEALTPQPPLPLRWGEGE